MKGRVADQTDPDLIGGMPGLLTRIIVEAPGQPFYVSNLGDALVRVEKKALEFMQRPSHKSG